MKRKRSVLLTIAAVSVSLVGGARVSNAAPPEVAEDDGDARSSG